jgi:phosphonate transport system substrate-binding protein
VNPPSDAAPESAQASAASPLRPRKWFVLFFFGLWCAAVAVTVVELVRVNRRDPRLQPDAWVDLREPFASGPDRPKPSTALSLRFAAAPVISPERSTEMYRGLVAYLADKTRRNPVFLTKPSYADINLQVRLQNCDFAFVSTYAYVIGRREFGMRLLAAPVIKGETTYRSYILVHRSSPAASLSDLRGARFAAADDMSTSGWLYPRTLIRGMGFDPETFFAEKVGTGGHDRSIEAVVSRFVDAAAVNSIVYDQMSVRNPEIVEQTRIIQKSPPYGMPPFVVPEQIDPDLERQILAILLRMHEDAEGAQVLYALGFDRFVVPEDSWYDSVRQMN